jgi:Na+/serine symporter
MDLHGIRGPINNWLNMFLTQRKMKAVVEGEQSEERGLMILVCYAFLDVSLYVCILYVQGVCMVLRLVIPAYRFPRHVYPLVLYTHHIFALSQSSCNVPVSI